MITVKVLDPKLIPVVEAKYGKYWFRISQRCFLRSLQKPYYNGFKPKHSEINCIRSYGGLAARFEVKPEVLAEADLNEIREAIRRGGL